MPPSGPPTAKVLIIGEAPGEVECLKGEGWVGPAGWLLGHTLHQVGINLDECAKSNSVWINPGKYPTGYEGALLMREFAPQLDEVLAASQAKVVVAAGGVALQRLTGLTDITNWRGSVLRDSDLAKGMLWAEARANKGRPAVEWERVWPPGAVVVPVLHPSGILRDPKRTDLFLLRRDLEKVAAIANGTFKQLEYKWHFFPRVSELMEHFADAREIYLDTEFNPESGHITWIGLSCNGRDVWGFPPLEAAYKEALRNLLGRPHVVYMAHNKLADERILRGRGIEVKGRFVCSMIQMYCLHPGTEVGLSPTSRYYLDDVMHRKWMEKDDPIYNGFDVLYGHQSYIKQLEEAARRPVRMDEEIRVRQELLGVTDVLEERGMLVCGVTQAALRASQEERISQLREVVDGAVRGAWEAHNARRLELVATATAKLEAHVAKWNGACPRHKTGWKKMPKHTHFKDCVCVEVWETGEAQRVQMQWHGYKNDIKQQKKGLKKQLEGFNPGSNDHLKWFLYSPVGLHLPIQRHHKTKQPTSGAAAIEKLSKLVKVKAQPEKWRIVEAIKGIQECEKAISTFIEVEVDANGYTHPSYKVHGTVTGRLAGGEDKKGELDKAMGEGGNPLNIPEEWRSMYVAPRGYQFVAADWVNQEGRLCAYFSQDANYLRQFAEEEKGGPDVHCQGAAILYGIDPVDARKVMVKMAGTEMNARDGAKRGRHAYSYNENPVAMLMHQMGCELQEAVRIKDAFDGAYPQLAAHKERLVREVCGRYEVDLGGKQPRARQVERGRGWMANPFGWMLEFPGIGHVRIDLVTGEKVATPTQANEVLAFPQQSTGASMWSRVQLAIQDIGAWGEWMPIYCGSYDNDVLCVPDTTADRDLAIKVLRDTMERGWAELDGTRYPISITQGYNLGPRSNDNVKGLGKL